MGVNASGNKEHFFFSLNPYLPQFFQDTGSSLYVFSSKSTVIEAKSQRSSTLHEREEIHILMRSGVVPVDKAGLGSY